MAGAAAELTTLWLLHEAGALTAPQFRDAKRRSIAALRDPTAGEQQQVTAARGVKKGGIFSMFGGSKPPQKTTTEVIQTIDGTADLMAKRLAVLQRNMDQEMEKARALMAPHPGASALQKERNKKQALVCLKKKKLYEEQYAQLEAQRFNMEQMQLQMENQALVQQQLKVQQQVAAHMKQNSLSADKVDEIRDEIHDAMDTLAEANQVLAEPMGEVYDDDDALAELEALMEEPTGAQQAGAQAATGGLGDVRVPQHNLAPQQAEKQRLQADLAELEALMAA